MINNPSMITDEGGDTVKKDKDSGDKKEILIEWYEGHEPRQHTQRMAAPGLYVLQVKTLAGDSHVHIDATAAWQPTPPTAHITTTRTPTLGQGRHSQVDHQRQERRLLSGYERGPPLSVAVPPVQPCRRPHVADTADTAA
ncbi:uncharacterized protein LOC121867049 [Homarus americanus]|uniref:uncharacterized protein LOC121867049 n=1 Tax=Homarus americanus TaxID=6706 RepID=UPI001C468C4A|nr:uncharacterized protein LOC121867049 [Homarus americanus]